MPDPHIVQNSRHTYRLRFTDLGRDLDCDTEFEAAEDYRALIQVRQSASNRPVRFQRDGKDIATVRALPGGAWFVTQSNFKNGESGGSDG